jgi:hypothetical protein
MESKITILIFRDIIYGQPSKKSLFPCSAGVIWDLKGYINLAKLTFGVHLYEKCVLFCEKLSSNFLILKMLLSDYQ